MCPHINNNFTPVADNLPPAVVRSAESAAGGSDLNTSEVNRAGTVAAQAEEINGSQFRSGGGVESRHALARPMANSKEAHPEALNLAGVAPGPLASFPIPHICISCGCILRAKQDASRVVVYCGYGPCKSKAANEGAFGRTVEEAVEELNARILEEEQ